MSQAGTVMVTSGQLHYSTETELDGDHELIDEALLGATVEVTVVVSVTVSVCPWTVMTVV